MKKIGEGWQYTVYDLGNGRVYKKYNSWLRSYWIIMKDCFPSRMDIVKRVPAVIRKLRLKAFASFETIRKSNLSLATLGNPTFNSELNYEQDKIVPLHVIFEKSTKDESKRYIDAFIVLNKGLISNRCIDNFFNISKNFGVNQKDEIVLADLGELIHIQEKIDELRKDRVWAVDYKSRSIANPELRAYFMEQMDKHFSLK